MAKNAQAEYVFSVVDVALENYLRYPPGKFEGRNHEDAFNWQHRAPFRIL